MFLKHCKIALLLQSSVPGKEMKRKREKGRERERMTEREKKRVSMKIFTFSTRIALGSKNARKARCLITL